MKEHQLINQDSGNVEYYTPVEIIEAARATMGSIDLDPFSSKEANRVVGASEYFTEGGFEKHWNGNIWCNHPFSRENNKLIAEKAVAEYLSGRAKQICMITFAATSEKWFRPLLDFPQCFLYGRTNYRLSDGTIKKGVTKGSVVTYFGRDVDQFKTHFSQLGKVKI